jgi:hypothetical protein
MLFYKFYFLFNRDCYGNIKIKIFTTKGHKNKIKKYNALK